LEDSIWECASSCDPLLPKEFWGGALQIVCLLFVWFLTLEIGVIGLTRGIPGLVEVVDQVSKIVGYWK